MLSGSLNSLTFVQFANMYVLVKAVMLVFRKSCIPVSPVQYLNADWPIFVILDGKDESYFMPAQY